MNDDGRPLAREMFFTSLANTMYRVVVLQRALMVAADGAFGPRTRTAVVPPR
jgi:Predicted Peptidoglycan domain